MGAAAPGAPGARHGVWRPGIIDGYILRMLAWPAAAVLGVTLVAFLLEQTLRLINELAAKGAHLDFLFGLIGNLIPYQLGLAIPAAFFAAMFIVIARLDEDSELDALLAGGVSFERIVAPLVVVGVVLGVVSLLLVGYLQPYSRFGYRAVRNAAMEAGWTAQLDPEVFINAGPDFTISADEADAAGRRLKGVFIRRKSVDGETVLTATSGVLGLRPDGKTTELHLNNGIVLADVAKGGVRLVRFVDFTDRENLGGSESLRPRGGDEQELTLPELVQEMGRKDTVIPRRVLEAEFYARLARSLALPFLPLLALPLAMAAKRGRRAPGMIVGAVTLVAFHHGITLVKGLATSGFIDPVLAMGGLFCLMAAFALWVFLSSRRHKGETPFSGMFHAIETMFERRTNVANARTPSKGQMSFGGYLGRIMLVRTAAAAAALIGLLQLIDLLERTNDLLARGGALAIGKYMLLRLPGLFQQAAPFAVLAGAVFTFSQLARNSELVVMRITGLSLFEIFRRTLPVAVAITALQLVVADQVTPRAEQALSTWLKATAPPTAQSEPSPRWFRIGGDIVMVRSSTPNGAALRGVSIYQRDTAGALTRRMTAVGATAERDGWRLHDARVTDLGPSHAENMTVGEMDWRTSLRPSDMARLFSDAYQVTSNTALRSLSGSGPVDKSPQESQTRLFRTLAEGAAPIIMLLLSLPAALGYPRSNKTAPVVFGLGCGLLYLVSDGLLTAMGQTGALPPILAAWGAPLVFAAGAVTVLLYAER
jgi:lipopolysaccharide export system permease protein